MSQLTNRGAGSASIDDTDVSAGIQGSALIQTVGADITTLLTRFGNPATDTSTSNTLVGKLLQLIEKSNPDVEMVSYYLNAAPEDLFAGYSRFNTTTNQLEYFNGSTNVQLPAGTFTIVPGAYDTEPVPEYWKATADQAGGSPEYLDGHSLRETRFYDTQGNLLLTTWENLTTQTILTAPPATGQIEIDPMGGSGSTGGAAGVPMYAQNTGTGYTRGDRVLFLYTSAGSLVSAVNLTTGALLAASTPPTDFQEEKPSDFISSISVPFPNGGAAIGLGAPPAAAVRCVLEYEALRTSNDRALVSPGWRSKIEGAGALPSASDGELRYHGDVEELKGDEMANYRAFRKNTQAAFALAINVRYYNC